MAQNQLYRRTFGCLVAFQKFGSHTGITRDRDALQYHGSTKTLGYHHRPRLKIQTASLRHTGRKRDRLAASVTLW